MQEQEAITAEQMEVKIPTVEQMTTRVEPRTTSVELMVQGTTKMAQSELEPNMVDLNATEAEQT